MSNIITKVPRSRRYRFKIWHDAKKLCFKNYSAPPSWKNDVPSNNHQPKIKPHEVEVKFSNGQVMAIRIGELARLADGCATVTLHDTTVMAAVMSKEKISPSPFVPLTVNFQQKAAASGRIPLNFIRREVGVTDQEIITSRVIDRSIRPLFQEDFNWDTQIICNPLALDGNNFPDVLSINAASAALAVSDIPWLGPVGAVRVGYVHNQVFINPSKRELTDSVLNLIVASRAGKLIVMMEGSAKNILIPDFLKALKVGVKESQKVVTEIQNLALMCGNQKRVFEPPKVNPELEKEITEFSVPKLEKIFQDHSHDKSSRDNAVSSVQVNVLENLSNNFSSEDLQMVPQIFQRVCKRAFRESLFETGLRCDGRELGQLRDINCQVDLYKPLHGSALFQRGQTQVMCTVSLDSPNSALKMDRVTMITSGLKEKNFFVHYQFPPFATREIGRLGPIGRREVGHGALAENALKSNIPENFPLTIRLTSEVLESNGSSSMATVCGGSLALMDAGVPLENACAGVAMGLISKHSGDDTGNITDFRILTDLMGIEDHFGDMDFKIAGTKKALTALQMDIKTAGVPSKIVIDIINQSRSATQEILKKMNEVCKAVRMSKDSWPVIKKITIPIHARRKFLGPGGMNVKRLEMQTGVEITESDAGDFEIFAVNKEVMAEAEEFIMNLLKSTEEQNLEFGGVYSATIVEMRDHGCMVTLARDTDPIFIHTSQLDKRKVLHPSALGLEVGDVIQVKYFGRDPVSGAVRVSRKVLQGTTSEILHTLIKKDDSGESSPSTEASSQQEGQK